jgi:hypothetical protein
MAKHQKLYKAYFGEIPLVYTKKDGRGYRLSTIGGRDVYWDNDESFKRADVTPELRGELNKGWTPLITSTKSDGSEELNVEENPQYENFIYYIGKNKWRFYDSGKLVPKGRIIMASPQVIRTTGSRANVTTKSGEKLKPRAIKRPTETKIKKDLISFRDWGVVLDKDASKKPFGKEKGVSVMFIFVIVILVALIWALINSSRYTNEMISEGREYELEEVKSVTPLGLVVVSFMIGVIVLYHQNSSK